MRVPSTRLLAVSLLALGLAACDKTAELPDGQVVATVDGKEVTIHELNAELAQVRADQNTPRKLLEQVALARVVERKMLANEARTMKLDARPEFLLSQTRASESLLVQALQAEVTGQVPRATREASQKFVEENPQVFADRRIFTLDQIQFLRPQNLEQLPLARAKTMDEVERILIDASIEYRRAPQQIDSLTINPKLTSEVTRIASAENPEPFMFIDTPPNAIGQVVFVNNVIETKVQPFTGERAINYAEVVLQQQSVQKRLASELERWKEAYKPKIVYAKNYGPPDPTLLNRPAGATPAPAPGARRAPRAVDPADATSAATS